MTCIPNINCTQANCHFKNTHAPTSRWATGSGTSGSATRRTSWRLRRRRTCTLQKPPRLPPSVLAALQVLERLLLFFIFGCKAYMILFVVVFMSLLLLFVVTVFIFSIGFSFYCCCDSVGWNIFYWKNFLFRSNDVPQFTMGRLLLQRGGSLRRFLVQSTQ